MKTINRTVLLITPKQPYLDWANSFDDDGSSMPEDKQYNTAIRIPENIHQNKALPSLMPASVL